VIDGGRGGNGARWLNHACMANCEAIEEAGRVYIDALRDIQPGEELLIDYALEIPPKAREDSSSEYTCLAAPDVAAGPCSVRSRHRTCRASRYAD
jgi:SET domain-containing protein